MSIKKQSLYSTIALLLVVGVMVAPVSARVQNAESTATTSQQASDNAQAQQLLRLNRETARKAIQAEREQNREERKAAIRQRTCETRKAVIEKRLTNAQQSAQKHYNTFTKIYERVQQFKTKKGLTVANYDALIASADTAKASTEAAVAALGQTETTIDCSQDPAVSVATTRETIKSTKKALKDYRTAIKNVIVALKASAAEEE